MESVLFDTHGYVKRLESVGISPSHAEAHAEALLEAMRGGLVTKADLLEVKNDLKQDISTVRAEIRELETRLTLRFGLMLAAGVGLIVALEKLLK